jgi:ankyrin repeat protein
MTPEWAAAIGRGDTLAIQAMASGGVDVNSCDAYGQTALMIAAHEGKQEVVKALIEAGADLDASAKYRLTPLMLAVIGRHVDVARILVEAGADLEARTSGAPGFEDKTAYELAVALGLGSLAEELRPPSTMGTML